MGVKRRVSFSKGENKITIGEAFRDFINDKVTNNLAPKTIDNYIKSYDYFIEDEFDGNEDIELETINKLFIEQWKDTMLRKGMRVSTINHYLRDVRTFFYWCMNEDRKYMDNSFKINLIKGQEALPKIFDENEVTILLQEPLAQRDWVEWRTWAIVNWVVGTGNRASTICNIQIGDIDFINKEVTLRHTKSKQNQRIALSSAVITMIKKYINKCRKGKKPNDWLFPSVSEEQLTYNALRLSFANYCRDRGVSRTNIHGLRHFFATDWIRKGGRGDNLQCMLGHSTYTMTQNYIKLVNNDLKVNLDEFNPLDNLRKSRKRSRKVEIS